MTAAALPRDTPACSPAGRVSFEQIYFSPERRRDPSMRAWRSRRSRAARSAWQSGDRLISTPRSSMPTKQRSQCARQRVRTGSFALPPGAWHGPVASAYGFHLVRVGRIEPTAARLRGNEGPCAERWREHCSGSDGSLPGQPAASTKSPSTRVSRRCPIGASTLCAPSVAAPEATRDDPYLLRAIVALAALAALPALAHEVRPAYLDLREVGEAGSTRTGRRRWRATGASPSSRCSPPTGNLSRSSPGARATRPCRRGSSRRALRGQSLTIRGLETTLTDALVRIDFADGTHGSSGSRRRNPRRRFRCA
jgi:hypothetical protein